MNQAVYPVVISKGKKFFVVDVPDFDCRTQGKDIAEAIMMAKDARMASDSVRLTNFGKISGY